MNGEWTIQSSSSYDLAAQTPLALKCPWRAGWAPHADTHPGHSGGQSSPGDTGTVLSQGHSGHHSGSHRLADTPVHKIHQGRL